MKTVKSESKPQPHSDLREMLQTITPLPWRTSIGEGEQDRFVQGNDPDRGAVLVADCYGETWEEIACPSDEQYKANAQYLTHCANVLPGLLKAAEGAREALINWMDIAEDRDERHSDTEALNALSDAIAAAHGGNVAARLTAEDMPTGGPITSPKDELRTYTVLLLYPDYIASNFGQETYMTSVQALDPSDAVAKAQREAMDEQSIAGGEDGDEEGTPEDFYPLMVIEGEHQDVNP